MSDPKRRFDLLSAFSSLSYAIANGYETELNILDITVIHTAMNTAPYRLDEFRVVESACEYYISTPIDELETEKMALFLADVNQTELDGWQAFHEQSYNTLSSVGKNKIDSLIGQIRSVSGLSSDEYQDRFEQGLRNGRSYLIRRYEKFCNSLPEIRSWVDSNVNNPFLGAP